MLRAQAALRVDPGLNISTVALDLPCSFFMLRTVSSLPIVAPVSRHFVWSREMNRLAQKVIDGMAAATGVRLPGMVCNGECNYYLLKA